MATKCVVPGPLARRRAPNHSQHAENRSTLKPFRRDTLLERHTLRCASESTALPMTKLENTENKTASRMLAISLAGRQLSLDAPVAGAGDDGFMQSPCLSEYAISPMSTMRTARS